MVTVHFLSAQRSKRHFTRHAVNVQRVLILKFSDRRFSAGAEDAVKAACAVAVAEEQPLQNPRYIALHAVFNIEDSQGCACAENAVNVQTCARLAV